MPNQHSAYYLIEADLEKYCQRLFSFLRSVYWIHESVVSNYIGLPKGSGTEGQSNALTSLIACIKAGFGGKQRDKAKKTTGYDATDLKEQGNLLGVSFQKWGAKEKFSGAL